MRNILAISAALGLLLGIWPGASEAECCWMVGCDGYKGWLKIARDDEKDMGTASMKLFGTAKLPETNQIVTLKRYAYLRDEERSARVDRIEDPGNLGNEANLLGPGSRVRIWDYEEPGKRFVLVLVIESLNDQNSPSTVQDSF